METNVDWRQVDPDCQLWKVAREWAANSRTVVSNNRRIPTSTHKQWGGTAMICMNDICAFENGKDRSRDFRGLGRWSGMTFAGKMNAKITFLTHPADHPDYIHPSANTPRKLFGYDLKLTVLKLKAAGHQVFVMGDFNADYHDLRQWMADLGLVDLIGQRHGCESLPITCKKLNNSPIDAIFSPPHMAAYRCGFLKFGTLGGDHRGLWIDIPKRTLFGCKIPAQVPAIFRRLILEDPRVVEKYNEILEKEFRELKIYDRTMTLYREATFPLSPDHALIYEQIDADIVRSQEIAEKK
ncbi:hypothetical protein CTEN210_15976 [Chaetoceros tenuissimus]|uniref:Endonuclease/exonuclease/phosphatase domain-containing protein n=1 Tax=Chaetoceros tenuissimus TaxID=426638 RepID=A0AAD3DAQ7_9STRA|nr:hypothetical protein CTEN210_15976 [Chaetoceros tenuissimus]